MPRRVSLTIVLTIFVGVASWPLRADVAPFPSWRVATNGQVAAVVRAGSAIYVGGTFTKIGPAGPPYSAMLDPETLTFTRVSGCARTAESVLGGGRYLPVGTNGTPIATLTDANGPFSLPPDTVLVRLGPDCRYDRRFRVALPPDVTLFPVFGGTVVEVDDRVYFQASLGTSSASPAFLVAANRATGDIVQYWSTDATSSIRIFEALPGGRLLATAGGFTNPTSLGWIDPAQGGTFEAKRSLSGLTMVVDVGEVVVIRQRDAGNDVVFALDAATLAPLANWPVVSAPIWAVATSGAGLVFVAGQSLTVGGVSTPGVVAFDAATGTRVPTFASPSWMDSPRSTVSAMVVANSRVVVFGNFEPGAPRDTVAALDAATGALDPWALTDVLTFSGWPIGGLRYFPSVTGRDRVARTNLAAVDTATGHVLPWAVVDSPAVFALGGDADSGYLYSSSRGRVRRYALTSAEVDPLWTLDVVGADAADTRFVTALAVGLGRVYAVGDFTRVRDSASSPWQQRPGGAAVTTAGALTAWRPDVSPSCTTPGPRPFPQPCVRDLRISEGRVFLRGQVIPLAPGDTRSLMAVSADTGVIDAVLAPVPAGIVNVIDAGPTELYADAWVGQARHLAAFSASTGPRLLAPVAPTATQSLAALGGRLYFDVEREATNGAPTGNRFVWTRPVVASDGVVDIDAVGLSWHAALAPRAPVSPRALTAELDGPTVTLRWRGGDGDLEPFVAPPIGGSAATSHVLVASLTSGGSPIAQLDLPSAATSHTLAVPPGTFYVRVLAKNAFGTSAPSPDVRVDVRPQAPGPPVVTEGSVQGRVVSLRWRPPSGGWSPTGYLLDAGTGPGLTDIGSLPVSGLAFSTTVPPGRYYVRVRAVNASGASAPGDEVMLDVR